MDGSGTTGPLLNHISVNVHGLFSSNNQLPQHAIDCHLVSSFDHQCLDRETQRWRKLHVPLARHCGCNVIRPGNDLSIIQLWIIYTSLPIWYSLMPPYRSRVHPIRSYLKGYMMSIFSLKRLKYPSYIPRESTYVTHLMMKAPIRH